ncbi:hypothetical protein KW807_02595 [Candidatus Parcubacteria bacterium]|nr:hypothetical protein [Candidatus Parcubacteria bacterium]
MKRKHNLYLALVLAILIGVTYFCLGNSRGARAATPCADCFPTDEALYDK